MKNKKLDPIEVFTACCNEVKKSERARLGSYLYIYLLNISNYNYYSNLGKYKKIQTLQLPVIKSKEVNIDQLEEDFRKLYDNQLSKSSKKVYGFYQEILNSANGRCFYCESGIVKELDHFLPKANYKIFSIYPPNLIPCCRDCNRNKNDQIIQLHPCLDKIHEYKWLFAKIVDDKNGSTVMFYSDPPKNLDWEMQNKIKEYFSILGLGKIYASECARDLSDFKESDINNLGIKKLRNELKNFFKYVNKERINHWKNATLECIDQASDEEIAKLLRPI